MQSKKDTLILKAAAKSLNFFIRTFLKAIPSEQQQEVIDDIDKGKRKISIRSGHGTGKTTLLAWIVIWWGLFREDAKLPMTAPTSHQLYDLLLPEVRKWRERLPDRLKEEIEVKSEKIDFANNNFAVARTARKDQPEALQGFHATNLAFIIDEASGIPQVIFEVAEGAMTGEETLVIMAANPTRTEGYFYDSHHKNRWQWACYQFNAEESANVSKKWVEEKRRQYGEDSDVYRVRVKGEFPRQSSDAVFVLEEVENAIAREVYDDSGGEVWGLDIADYGDDKTVLAKRIGKCFYEIKAKSNMSLPDIAGWLIHEYKNASRKPAVIFADAIGIGSSLAAVCAERGLDIVVGVKASNSADDDGKYFNKRAEWYYTLKEFLEDGRLPEDDELVGELMAQRYKISTNGKLQLIPKREIKNELGRSPDKADACAIACNGMAYALADSEEVIDVEIEAYAAIPYNIGGAVW
ncbi:terminase large subunit domain-containing protein [Hydrogenimonas sp.]